MTPLDDTRLWAHVRRSVTPLGQPCPGPRRAYHPRGAPPAVDLHGHAIHAAHGIVRETVRNARAVGRRDLVVVTGRSGAIRTEFEEWARLHPDVRSAVPLNGGGAYRLRLRDAFVAPR